MIKKYLSSKRFLRKIIFPFFRLLDLNLLYFHPVSKRLFYLKFWSHKGYWFYGANREAEEINLIKKLISNGDNVLDAGAHIGFLTQIFEDLIYQSGEVIAIEPSPKNLIFLNKNLKNQTKIIPVALSNKIGKGDLYLDNYGGFTNSLKKEFTKVKNVSLSKSQSAQALKISKDIVNIETIDSICNDYTFKPSFLKIDVEGSELEVLKGASRTLKTTTFIMIEISNDHKLIFDILRMNGFYPIDSNANITKWNKVISFNKNYFFKNIKKIS